MADTHHTIVDLRLYELAWQGTDDVRAIAMGSHVLHLFSIVVAAVSCNSMTYLGCSHWQGGVGTMARGFALHSPYVRYWSVCRYTFVRI